MTKSCAILQSNYIPWKGYFDLIHRVQEFVFYDCVQYTKNDWRNRNKIKTEHGAQWLTIPVSAPSGLRTLMNEVMIADPNWQRKHWTAIQCNYAKAQNFCSYSEELKEFYMNTNTTNLSDVNQKFIRYLCEKLSITTRITNATEYELEEERNLRLIGICKQVGATRYVSGPSAKSYIDLNLFKQHSIEVEWMDYANYPAYEQLFPPFEHSVTVLDLLLNVGEDAKKYMLSF